ncbi:hypothetical protein FACS1894122_01480 [Alphaproteobacteria bacterium]|nr:hypothetical protein FACS1894122_01480 [Alphaproteobacteria bacterium]
MFRFLHISVFLLFLVLDVLAVPIDTPDRPEENKFVIKCPVGWAYRSLNGDNGLIGLVWPAESTFNATGTAVFVFLQDSKKPRPKVPCHINLFTEKCTKAEFNFYDKKKKDATTKSLNEKYFRGRCGRTMILFEEVISNYTLIFAFISDGYVTKSQLASVKEIVANYREEVEAYIKDIQKENQDDNDTKKEDQNDSE